MIENHPQYNKHNKSEQKRSMRQMEVNSSEVKKTNKKREKISPINYPYAEWLLGEIKDQYNIENERENKISTKASAFITVIVAIITVYIPLIPFEGFKEFFLDVEEVSNIEKIVVFVFLVTLFIGLVLLFVAFYYMVKAYNVKGYNRVDVDDLIEISGIKKAENNTNRSTIAQGMVAHYHEILRGTIDIDGNMKINTNSATDIEKGIKLTVVGFVIISIATMILRSIVVS